MITHKQTRPLVIYGVTKVQGEALGRHFVESYGIPILCVRIGRVNQANRPETIRDRAVYLSHRDIPQMLQKCIDAHYSLDYDIFFVVSNNR